MTIQVSRPGRGSRPGSIATVARDRAICTRCGIERTIKEGSAYDPWCRDCQDVEGVTSAKMRAARAVLTEKRRAETRCANGHEYTPDNLVQSQLNRGFRTCLTCHNATRRARRALLRQQATT